MSVVTKQPECDSALSVKSDGNDIEFPSIAKRAARFVNQLGHKRDTLRYDNEPAIEALAREIAQARQEESQTVPERPPVGESQSNGIIECALVRPEH